MRCSNRFSARMRADDTATGDEDSMESAEDAPIIRMTNVLIQNAIKQGASDIHVEPDRRHVRIRYRIDGVLYEIMTLPKFAHAPVDLPLEDYVRYEYRRTAHPAGRPHSPAP